MMYTGKLTEFFLFQGHNHKENPPFLNLWKKYLWTYFQEVKCKPSSKMILWKAYAVASSLSQDWKVKTKTKQKPT